ncbi:MAG TPA: MATE family efflux transporter [Kofleriaceae bacterium]|nr:MATE family efflux transporter [Kofleriaceae bacterium]
MLWLAAPLVAQQAGSHLMGVVDAAMLGRYSDSALAAAGVGNNVYFAVSCVGMGIVMGMDTVVPQALGAGRLDDARRAVGAGVRLAIIVGLLATLLLLASPIVLVWADIDKDVLHEARPYLYMRALGVVPFLFTVALRSYLAAHGMTRPMVIAVIAGNIVNAGLDLALIYGVDAIGLPAFGVIGAAAATTIVSILTASLYALAVRNLDRGVTRPRSTGSDLKAIAHHGWPVGGQLLAEVGIFGVATVLAAHLGKVPAGAHSIALNLSSLTFSFGLGIASATSVRVGHAVGAGDLALARRRGLLGLVLGLVVMSCFAATFLLIPRLLATGFTDDSTVVAATIPLLQIAALFQLSDGTQAIGAGALRGRGDNKSTLIGNLLGHYVVGLPIIIGLGFGAGLGAPGLWWGLSAGLTVTALFLLARFLRSTSQSRR